MTDRLRELATAWRTDAADCQELADSLYRLQKTELSVLHGARATCYTTCADELAAVLVRETATEPPPPAQTPRVEARRDRPDGAEPALRRYDLVTNYRCGSSIEEMERSDDGEWVRYECVQQRVEELEADLAQSRAETEAADECTKKKMREMEIVWKYRAEQKERADKAERRVKELEAMLASSQTALPAAHGAAHPQDPPATSSQGEDQP